MNLDDLKMDSFDIHVWSDTDHTGIQLRISETGKNSGEFIGTAFFTTESKSSGTTLLVEDSVFAKHKQITKRSDVINESIEPEPPYENGFVCPPDKVFDWDICVDSCPAGRTPITMTRIKMNLLASDVTSIGKIDWHIPSTGVSVGMFVFCMTWRNRK